MKNEEKTLSERLKELMKHSQAQPAVEEIEVPQDQLEDNIDPGEGNPFDEIEKSTRAIRSYARKAELGDRSAVKRIDSELIAIERALKRASKFSLL